MIPGINIGVAFMRSANHHDRRHKSAPRSNATEAFARLSVEANFKIMWQWMFTKVPPEIDGIYLLPRA
jgi:hypothetical protein